MATSPTENGRAIFFGIAKRRRVRPALTCCLAASMMRTQMGQASMRIDEIVSVEGIFRDMFEGGEVQINDVASRIDEIAQTAAAR